TREVAFDHEFGHAATVRPRPRARNPGNLETLTGGSRTSRIMRPPCRPARALAEWDAMTEQPPSSKPQREDIAQQLEKTAADLRTLAEQLGAVPPGGPKPVSPRRA